MNIQRIRFRQATLATLVGIGVAATLLINANDTGITQQPALSPETTGPVAGSAALRATLNPETGRLDIGARGATLVLDPETREALRRDNEGLVEIYHPNGAVSVHLQGRFQHASVARIGKDGKVSICAEDTSAVTSMLENELIVDRIPVRTTEVK